MSWLQKKQTVPEISAEKNRIEIVTAKNAHRNVVEQARTAQKQLNNLLEENHFTIKIFLAAGGKTKKVGHKSGH